MTNKLNIVELSKRIGNRYIYKNTSLIFNNGCHAFTGENGIGKTILLQLVSGVTKIDGGKIYLSDIGDSESLDYKRVLTYVPSIPMFYPFVKGIDVLKFISSVKNANNEFNSDMKIFIEDSGLSKYLNTPFMNMSLGTQKKLFLASTFIGENKLIVLDEPDNGLDDNSIRLLIDSIIKMSKDKIILIASHNQDFLNSTKSNSIMLSRNQWSLVELDMGVSTLETKPLEKEMY